MPLIVIEGGHGVGKTTQATRLVRFLEESGKRAVRVREPGGTLAGEKIREILLDPEETIDLDQRAALLLFSASRAQLMRQTVVPALAVGTWVIMDRFYPSSTIYQPVFSKGTFDTQDAEKVTEFTLKGLPVADAIFILNAPVGVILERAGPRRRASERFKRVPDLEAMVQERYQNFLGLFGERVIHLDGTQPETFVLFQIVTALGLDTAP